MYLKKNPFGVIYLIIGIIIFLMAAGAFLLRLFFAVIGLWLIAYGAQLMSGRPALFFWRWPRD